MWMLTVLDVLLTITALGFVVVPYVTHYLNERTFKGVFREMGVGYVEAFYQTSKWQFADLYGTYALLFLFSSFLTWFPLALFVCFAHVMIVGRIATKAGHVPGTIEWQ